MECRQPRFGLSSPASWRIMVLVVLVVKGPDFMVTIISLTSLSGAPSLVHIPDRCHLAERYPVWITLSSFRFLGPQVETDNEYLEITWHFSIAYGRDPDCYISFKD